MQKGRGRNRFLLSIFEISLLILMSFAISFFISESFVSADFSVNTEVAGKAGAKTGAPLPSSGTPRVVYSGNKINNLKLTRDGTDIINGQVNSIVQNADGSAIINGQKVTAEEFTKIKADFASKGAVIGQAENYKIGGFIDTGLVSGSAPAHLLQGAVWAGVAFMAAKLVGPLIGLDKKNSNALGLALAAGALSYKGALALFGKSTVTTTAGGQGALIKPLLSNLQAGLIGIGIAAAVFIMLYKKETRKLVEFQCLPFEPPVGGAKCEECNKDPFRPCSEYRCKSLGQACQLLNPGTGEEACTWVNPKDVTSPTITPWTGALKPVGLKYISDTSIRPPALGVKIVENDNSCLPAFTPLEFGITTNEPSQCKIEYIHTNKFDEMTYLFGESNIYAYNHTQRMKLPGPESLTNLSGSPLLKNDGTFSLYVRCRDANGNENVDEFAVNFCVDKGPDTTPPIIDSTSIPDGSFVQFGADKVPIEVYVNEPSECKWSKQDKAYEDMENIMSCGTEEYQINSDLYYTCASDLTGVTNGQDNQFFFRCKDQPGKIDSERNVNQQSYRSVLKGSRTGLTVIDTMPNGTLFAATSSLDVNLQVETSNGAEEGKAICYFSTNANNLDSFIPMFKTNDFKHEQLLSLGAGSYTYHIRCIDAGGNLANSSTSFNVLLDKESPKVTRVYREGSDALKVITNEDAECVYSLSSCNYVFKDGIPLIYNPVDDKQKMFAEWKPSSTYYIKCRDEYGNEPDGAKCSIIANAIQLSKEN